MKFRPVPLWLLAVLSAGVIGLGYVAPKDDQPAMMCNSCRLVAESRRGTFKQKQKCCCVSGCSFSQRSFVASNPTPLYFVQPDPIEKQRGRESTSAIYTADLTRVKMVMTANSKRKHNFVCKSCHGKIRSARESAAAEAATQRGHAAHSKLVAVRGAGQELLGRIIHAPSCLVSPELDDGEGDAEVTDRQLTRETARIEEYLSTLTSLGGEKKGRVFLSRPVQGVELSTTLSKGDIEVLAARVRELLRRPLDHEGAPIDDDDEEEEEEEDDDEDEDEDEDEEEGRARDQQRTTRRRRRAEATEEDEDGEVAKRPRNGIYGQRR